MYSEGQRRYVETFSPYARQFLDRMDKPQVDRIEGIPPAIAIDQTNPVRTSRSTVGTMTELNDHVKLLYARAAVLHCRNCGREVRRDDAESIYAELAREPTVGGAAARVLVTFTVDVPDEFQPRRDRAVPDAPGLHANPRAHEDARSRSSRTGSRSRAENRARLIEALEAALKIGNGHVTVRLVTADDASADHRVQVLGAPALRALRHRVRRLHPELLLVQFARRRVRAMPRVRPHDRHRLSARDSGRGEDARGRRHQAVADEEQQGVPARSLRYAKQRGVPVDVPWRELTREQRAWVIDGEGSWRQRKWYGVARFFAWLESKAYKMHVRVLLSKYRSYDVCPTCAGARLKPESLLLAARLACRCGRRRRARAAALPRRICRRSATRRSRRCRASRSTTS